MYGLGKVTLVVAGANAHQMEYTGQAMAYYQAAMAVEPRNVRAANELGVLLANNGQLKQARDMLTRSASIAPNAATWQNLAVVHGRMGDRQTAEQLKQQASLMKKTGRDRRSRGAVGRSGDVRRHRSRHRWHCAIACQCPRQRTTLREASGRTGQSAIQRRAANQRMASATPASLGHKAFHL